MGTRIALRSCRVLTGPSSRGGKRGPIFGSSRLISNRRCLALARPQANRRAILLAGTGLDFSDFLSGPAESFSANYFSRGEKQKKKRNKRQKKRDKNYIKNLTKTVIATPISSPGSYFPRTKSWAEHGEVAQTKLNQAPFARKAEPRRGAGTGCRFYHPPSGTSPGKRPPSPPPYSSGVRRVPAAAGEGAGIAAVLDPVRGVGGEAAASQRGGAQPSAQEPEPLC